MGVNNCVVIGCRNEMAFCKRPVRRLFWSTLCFCNILSSFRRILLPLLLFFPSFVAFNFVTTLAEIEKNETDEERRIQGFGGET